MKKAILALMFLWSAAYGQKWQFKAGIVAPLPVDMQLQTRIQFKSILCEVSHKISPKVDLLLNGGFLKFNFRTLEHFENIVAIPGVRYNLANNIYFGANCGPVLFSENIWDNEIMWSPFVGIKGKKITADLRYFDWRKIDNNANTLGIVFSYIL